MKISQTCVLIVAVLLCNLVQCHDDPEKVVKARACLKNYGQLILHNVAHINSQKLLFSILENSKRLKKLTPEQEEYKVIQREINSDIAKLAEDKVGARLYEEISLYCDPKEEKLLQRVNVQESEEQDREVEKADHAQEQEKPHNLKMSKTDRVRTAVGKAVSITGSLVAVPPVILMLPICITAGIIGAIVTIGKGIKKERESKKRALARGKEYDDSENAGIVYETIGMGFYTAYLCLTPALLSHKFGKFLSKKIKPNNAFLF